MGTPRHISLEAQFRAAVPPQRASLLRPVAWRVALRLLALPVVQRFFGKKN